MHIWRYYNTLLHCVTFMCCIWFMTLSLIFKLMDLTLIVILSKLIFGLLIDLGAK